MASLREIKDRIGSVRSTLKITSAMKLVASAKLRKAQKAIEGMRPYERTLAEILAAVSPGRTGEPASRLPSSLPAGAGTGAVATAPAAAEPSPSGIAGSAVPGPTAVVAIASNSSLCGAFNANIVRETLKTIRACEGEVEVYPIGRKMVEALRRAGYTNPTDYNDLIGHPAYEKSAALARSLSERYQRGELGRVVLVYNRFVSTSTQEPTVESYLPFDAAGWGGDSPVKPANDEGVRLANDDYLLEPDAQALVDQLLPQVMILKFHAAILDSAAAEQAARTIAMQTATDNAEDLLGELTLEYNKGRQQKITAEILDLLGGAAN
ncbi:MAG: ATP synthase F1 subunit gamma [Bacteroidales bacterium]|nr:ATP synthase F1 subunit gamma [Bacteroidales bacterium]